nr:nickel insertion protein [Halopiger aswanensis]
METATGALEVAASGYGAGGYDLDPHPNVFRVLVGEGDRSLVKNDIAVLETNLDDATPGMLAICRRRSRTRVTFRSPGDDEEVPPGPPREGHLQARGSAARRSTYDW